MVCQARVPAVGKEAGEVAAMAGFLLAQFRSFLLGGL